MSCVPVPAPPIPQTLEPSGEAVTAVSTNCPGNVLRLTGRATATFASVVRTEIWPDTGSNKRKEVVVTISALLVLTKATPSGGSNVV